MEQQLDELRRRGQQVQVVGLDMVEQPELGVRREQSARPKRRCERPRLDEGNVMVRCLVHQVDVGANAVEVADGRDGIDEGERTGGQRGDRGLGLLQ